jgi:hypothetical protein
MKSFNQFLREKTENPDGEMALTQLRTVEMCCRELQKIINQNDDIEPWVQSKLSIATDYMTTILDYLKFSE